VACAWHLGCRARSGGLLSPSFPRGPQQRARAGCRAACTLCLLPTPGRLGGLQNLALSLLCCIATQTRPRVLRCQLIRVFRAGPVRSLKSTLHISKKKPSGNMTDPGRERDTHKDTQKAFFVLSHIIALFSLNSLIRTAV
jgi:hypothetical protein